MKCIAFSAWSSLVAPAASMVVALMRWRCRSRRPSFRPPAALPDDGVEGVQGRWRSGASRSHCAQSIGDLGLWVGFGGARWTSCRVHIAPYSYLYVAQRVGGAPTIDQLGAPDQGAIQREKAPAVGLAWDHSNKAYSLPHHEQVPTQHYKTVVAAMMTAQVIIIRGHLCVNLALDSWVLR